MSAVKIQVQYAEISQIAEKHLYIQTHRLNFNFQSTEYTFQLYLFIKHVFLNYS